jgi:hypothetical protein
MGWRMERDRGWSEPTDWVGKGLKKRLPPEVWKELEGTCAEAGIEENREALFRTLARSSVASRSRLPTTRATPTRTT